ncbi:DUF397 domain-containing protein [Kitasatospora aburaviensis]
MTNWQKSSISGNSNQCIEVRAADDGMIEIRESDTAEIIVRTTPRSGTPSSRASRPASSTTSSTSSRIIRRPLAPRKGPPADRTRRNCRHSGRPRRPRTARVPALRGSGWPSRTAPGVRDAKWAGAPPPASIDSGLPTVDFRSVRQPGSRRVCRAPVAAPRPCACHGTPG